MIHSVVIREKPPSKRPRKQSSLCGCAGRLESTLVANPEDSFLVPDLAEERWTEPGTFIYCDFLTFKGSPFWNLFIHKNCVTTVTIMWQFSGILYPLTFWGSLAFYPALLNDFIKESIEIWTASSEFGTYRICEQRRFRRACASAQSRQNLRCSLIQAVSQEEPSDRKPDPWLLWMAGHAQLKFVMTECSKIQIRLTGPMWQFSGTLYPLTFWGSLAFYPALLNDFIKESIET